MSRARHPEAGDDEVWIGNMFRSDVSLVGWATKRAGVTAYHSDGKPIPKGQGFAPVFVKRRELDDAGCLPPSPTPGTINHRW